LRWESGDPVKTLFVIVLLSTIGMAQAIPATNFGMHDGHAAAGGTPYPTVSFGSFRIWDVGEAQWPNLEPSRGTYNWTTLDNWISTLNSHGVTDIIYTFGHTPCWANSTCTDTLPPDNNQDTIDFITALATRYKGKIKHYETWNEPEVGFGFWTGTMAQLIQLQNDLYTTVKAIDSTATVHTPVLGTSATPGDCSNSDGGKFSINNFLAANGTSNFGAVDVHLYPYPDGSAPEVLSIVVTNVQCAMTTYSISSRPLWNTEFSWGSNTSVPSLTDQVAWLGRAYLYLWSQGVVRSYWYTYDGGAWGALWRNTEGAGTLATHVAYQQMYNWMVGATMTTNCTVANSVWTCGLTLANGNQALAVWMDVWKSTAAQSYAPASQYNKYHDLAGNTATINSGQSVTIGETPILFESAAARPNAPLGLTAIVR
jgi:Beta-galactosidase